MRKIEHELDAEEQALQLSIEEVLAASLTQASEGAAQGDYVKAHRISNHVAIAAVEVGLVPKVNMGVGKIDEFVRTDHRR